MRGVWYSFDQVASRVKVPISLQMSEDILCLTSASYFTVLYLTIAIFLKFQHIRVFAKQNEIWNQPN